MSNSRVPFFLKFNNFPKYPIRNDKAFSINQDKGVDVSKKADKAIWKLYEQAEKKLGRLGAYTQINNSIIHTEKDRLIALEKIQDCETDFLMNIKFYASNNPYPEVTPKILDQLKEMDKKYKPIQFGGFLKQYRDRSFSYLIHTLVFVDQHLKILKKIPRTELDQKAIKLKDSILDFDYMHMFHIRLLDLLELIKSKDIAGKINEGEFIRDIETIQEFNSRTKGPTVDDELFYDIERIFDQYLAEDFEDKDSIYHKDGKPIISEIVHRAIQEQWFAEKWSNEYPSNTKRGYDKRALEGHFSEFYPYYEK